MESKVGPPGHIFDKIDPEVVAEVEKQAPKLNQAAMEYKTEGQKRVFSYYGMKLYYSVRSDRGMEAKWPEWADMTDEAQEIWRERAAARRSSAQVD